MSDCLGNGDYAARIMRRRSLLGPARPLGELPTLEGGTWARSPQTTTDANVTVALEAEGCVEVLNRVDPWRDELEVWRGDDVVWSGPVQDVLADPAGTTATVTAKDSSAWWPWRALNKDFHHADVDLATIFGAYLAYAFRLDDPQYAYEVTPSGVLGTRIIAASDLKMLDGEVAELARTGLDWTTVGRTFWIGPLTSTLRTRLTDDAFAQPPQVRRTGAGMALETFVRGNGHQGHYGGPDPQDGLLLQAVRDEQAIADTPSANAAAKSWWDRVHEPMVYVEGQNTLSPDAPVDVQTLIPGTLVPVDLAGGGVVPFSGTLRLESVSATFADDGEGITVALQPVGATEDG